MDSAVRSLDENAIFEVMTNALLSARLAPGTRLGEQKLADTFGVTRERIRKVLQRLGTVRLIDMVPNHGAFVVNPTLDESRLVYEARRIVEAGIVASLAERASESQVQLLREHVTAEDAAHHSGDRVQSTKLSGGFHMVLARMTANPFIMRQMQELVIRTTMLDAYFDVDFVNHCGIEEHGAIVDALARHDGRAAVRAMTSHLSEVETRFRPKAEPPAPTDIEDVILDEIRLWQADRAEKPAG
ncbi:GntR family transcriptional regulator [Zavarzinia sp.]|uniref:GntR family transcriptional regulator n=1 Tax=Zavarzinia sp. TaxID=2027920 RepID=UPI0035679ECD